MRLAKRYVRELARDMIKRNRVFKSFYDGYNADDENGIEHIFDEDGNEL